MQEIATLRLHDAATGDEVVAIVRVNRELVSLGISLRNDGDIDVNLAPEDCMKLLAAMQQAVLLTEKP